MRSPLERYTLYQQIYKRFSSPTRPHGQNGRILRHSHAMNGSAGLSPSRNRKPEGSTLSVYARSSRKECAGLVAGLAVLTAEMRLTSNFRRHLSKARTPDRSHLPAWRALQGTVAPLDLFLSAERKKLTARKASGGAFPSLLADARYTE